MARTPFATRADIEFRHPTEAAILCADERTRQPDWGRVVAALEDVSGEIRMILAKRYAPASLDDLDEDSLAALKVFACDMALYRVSLSFGRQTEAIHERYTMAVKRLEGIATGRGGLTFKSLSGGGEGGSGDAQTQSPNQVLFEANERLFTRDRMKGW